MVDESRAPNSGGRTDSANADPEVRVDRRRPGRTNYIDKNLIALLRRSETSDVSISPLSETDAEEIARTDDSGRDREAMGHTDDLALSRGIALALLIVTPFWAEFAALCAWLIRR